MAPRSTVAALGIGLLAAYAPAQVPGRGAVPKLDNRYIKQHPCPTIAPGSCFGYFQPKWTRWGDACPQWAAGGVPPAPAPPTPTKPAEVKPDPLPLPRELPTEEAPPPRPEPRTPPDKAPARANPEASNAGLPAVSVPPLAGAEN